MADKTQHYGLPQWEVQEGPARAAVNGCMTAVDAALNALAGQLGGKADQSALNSSIASVNGSISNLSSRISTVSARSEVRTGTYTGNGASSRTISLGFTPEAVLVESRTGLRGGEGYGGLALNGVPCVNASTIVEIVSGGFRVFSDSGRAATNASGDVYRYLAVK